MSATLNERSLSASTSVLDGGLTRVAIREVREATVRALVAIGASNAEAKVSADQVLFDELHYRSGLVSLLAELSSGPWTRAGLTCERDTSSHPTVLRVTGPGRPGALAQGALLGDLVAAETDLGTVVVSDGLDTISPLLDEPLIRTARTSGCWVLAVDRAGSAYDFRVASPDGAIGVSVPDARTPGELDSLGLPSGVSLVRLATVPEAGITWLTVVEQQATRATAARSGLLVDTEVWAEVITAASAYLVPEQ